jgi:hypothetical protein
MNRRCIRLASALGGVALLACTAGTRQSADVPRARLVFDRSGDVYSANLQTSAATIRTTTSTSSASTGAGYAD